MEITVRGLWTLIHGMGFGALYLLACSGALVELYRFTTSSAPYEFTAGQDRFLKFYLLTMVVLAWAAVLIGAYVIYPWYRAAPPPGTSRSVDVSAAAADVESHHHRLALAGNGVEGARRLVHSDLDYHGRVRFHQVWSRPQKPSTSSRRGALFCRWLRLLLRASPASSAR